MTIEGGRWRRLRLGWAAVALVACSSDAPVQAGADYRIVVVSGDKQLGRAMAPLGSPLVARVEDAETGAAAKGVRVKFSVDRGTSQTATLFDSVSVSDGDGFAKAWLTLGSETEPSGHVVVVRAAIAAAQWRSVRFTAVAGAGAELRSVTPADVRAGDTVHFTGASITGLNARAWFGAVSVPVLGLSNSGSVVVPACLPAGSIDFSIESDGARSNSLPIVIRSERTPLTLAPYEHITLPASRLADCISLHGDGATYLIAAQFASAGDPTAVDWQLGADGLGSAVAVRSAPSTAKHRMPNTTHRDFEATLRRLEESVAPEARATRAARSAPIASLTAPPLEGSLRSFHVVAKTDGTEFTTVTARLRFVGQHLLVYTDTADRGFTDEQLLPMSSLFDRDLYGAAINAFGADPDIDGNDKVIALYTPVINRMSRAEDCLLRGYVTGFFYPVDQIERTANSNRAEIFYSFVPDPTGRYSCTHTEAEVVRTIQATFIHEMQHLISFNERVLARSGEAEETWLNEGLSQIAEELGSRVFESRYPAPLGRGTTAQLFPDSAAPFMAPNMLNAYVYMFFATQNSLTSFKGTGTFEERGGAWLFLRWLADQKGEGVLRRLVQGSRRGIANVEAVAGESLGALFGDFSLALFADSLPTYPRGVVPPRLRFTSRNVRQLMAREATISGFMDPFPLKTYALAPGASLRSNMPAGTMMHAILQGVPGGPPVRLAFTRPDGSAFPATLGAQVSIMRLPQ